MDIKNDIELYKEFDPQRKKGISELSLHLKWPENKCYVYKYFISELKQTELELLVNSTANLDLSVVAAICIQNERYHHHLFQNLLRIQNANSAFNEIDLLINEIAGQDPLTFVTNQYWIDVGNYLTSRRINVFPFNKKSIGFIKTVGYKGYTTLSKQQKQWIQDLILQDKLRPIDDRFFINEHLIHFGHAKDCLTIENYERCH